jgi:hypothetical protein
LRPSADCEDLESGFLIEECEVVRVIRQKNVAKFQYIFRTVVVAVRKVRHQFAAKPTEACQQHENRGASCMRRMEGRICVADVILTPFSSIRAHLAA